MIIGFKTNKQRKGLCRENKMMMRKSNQIRCHKTYARNNNSFSSGEALDTWLRYMVEIIRESCRRGGLSQIQKTLNTKNTRSAKVSEIQGPTFHFRTGRDSFTLPILLQLGHRHETQAWLVMCSPARP